MTLAHTRPREAWNSSTRRAEPIQIICECVELGRYAWRNPHSNDEAVVDVDATAACEPHIDIGSPRIAEDDNVEELL